MFRPFLFLLPPLLPSTSADTEIGKEDINALPVVPCHPPALRWPMASLGESGIDIIIGLFFGGELRTGLPSLLPHAARLSCGARDLGRQLLGFSNIRSLRCEFSPLSTIAHLARRSTM